MFTESFFKKCFYLLLVAAISLLFVRCQSDDKKVMEEMQQEADAINRQCPVTVDPSIRLDSCSVQKGRVFAYYYTVTNDSIFDAEQFRTIGTNNVRNTVISNPEMARMRYLGITFRYLYNDMKGNVMHTIEITPDDYKKPEKNK